MFPFTAGKMVSYEEIRSYLIDRNVPQIFESIMTGLMYHRPEDHLVYIEQCVAMIKQSGIHNLSWNTFIECSLPKIQRLPPVSKSTVSINSQNSQNTTERPDTTSEMNKNSTLPPIAKVSSFDATSSPRQSIGSKKSVQAFVSKNFSLPDCPIVFMTGVPSSGIMEMDDKITHVIGGYACISANAVAKGSKTSCSNYKDFLDMPSACLIEELMTQINQCQNATAIVILGFPRSIDDLQAFTEIVSDVDAVIMLDYNESMYRNKLQESSSEDQDNIERQISYFKEHTLPAVEIIEEMGVLNVIDIENDESMVMEVVLSNLSSIVENYANRNKKDGSNNSDEDSVNGVREDD